ncbi:sigma-70 family RNA polymerase sigma factor [Microbacterium sp.]|uniref:sigma-70 family RNA polymerase sigma factor n=1 Tax=Microbacterium sp. TaxID=51671 RepID=UPI003F980507
MTVHNDEPIETETAADADLILRTRSGDGAAFGELWRRHYPSGMAVARSVTSSIDPDDLVQEAYARIYQAVLKGGGPNGSFRAYLFTSIRNTAAAWGRTRHETAMDELETFPDPDSTEQASNEALDRGLTAQAFRSLPTRWQEVLWYAEIEQMKPAAIAPLLGMKAGAVSQLAFRAREGLREAWVQAHLRSTASDSECHWTIDRLGAYSRGNVSTRDRKRIDEHLESCARCLIVAGEAGEVSSRLALVMLPLVLGIAGAGGYTAMLQTGGVPAVAVAAMPSSVITGGVVVGGPVPVGADGAAGAAGAGSAGGGASGGAITGIGALVGAGSAALVVAGVVAAATIMPGLLNASPVTSLPGASGTGDSSISSDVTADDSIDSSDKLVLEVTEDKPDEDSPKPIPKQPAPPPVVEDAPVATEASTPVAEERPGDGEGSIVTPPTIPTDPPEPEGGDGDGETGGGEGETTDPGEGETNPGEGETDPGDGGTTDPGDGGTTDPGEGGETDPGEGGETDPGNGEEAPDPAGPTESVTVVETSVSIDSAWKTHLSITVQGVPGTTVQALINGCTAGADQIVLDVAGTGVLDLRPTLPQILSNAKVTIHYLTDDGVEHPLTSSLLALGLTRSVATEAAATAEKPTAVQTARPSENTEPEAVPTEEPTAEDADADLAPIEEPVVEDQPVVPEEDAPAEEIPAEQTAPVDEEPTPLLAETAPAEDTVPAE